jgi:glutamine synthetase
MARSGEMKPTPAYDLESALDAMPFLDRMVECMRETGFGVFSFDHEGGQGQFEFDFAYAPVLQMADRITLFRLMARQVAKECGLLVTFMPKPYDSSWGSGHHYNMSLAEAETGENLFRDDGDHRGRGWSKAAYAFVAGILRHARSLAAVATPTVNSYKRLAPRLADGSVSWAPVWASYGDNNRSCLLRLPRNRPAIENRGVDSAANTYLTAALMLAAGLEGVAEGLDPGEPVETLTYDWTPSSTDAARLPRTLLEAIDAFEEDPLVHDVFPARFVQEYVEMKRTEWDSYHGQVTAWERRRYLLDL